MSRTGWLAKKTLRKVALHLDTDLTIEGLVADSSSDGALLRSAKLLGSTTAGLANDTDLAGETWVPRERIVFAQELS